MNKEIDFLSQQYEQSFSKRQTKEVMVGNVGIGSNHPVRIQSMTNTDTMDTMATVNQVLRLWEAGCELVRLTAMDIKSAKNLYNIKNELAKRGCFLPLIADIHFNPEVALIAAEIVEKVRINPGNYTDRNIDPNSYTLEQYSQELERIKERLFPLIEVCKKHKTAIRIGTNYGSLSQRIVFRYGNTPLAMAISAFEFANICHLMDFDNLVLSQKASNVKIMVHATRLLCQILDEKGLNYPIHLGVTEAGQGQDGRIKSAIGIGTLLSLGIGNTIRVSLTENPVEEIPVAKDILQALGEKLYKTEFVSCPSCGRTKYDIEAVLAQVKEKCSHLAGIKIGVMGCIVNGPGEMADCHYGYIGTSEGKVNLYRSKEVVFRNVNQENAIDKLIEMIKEDGLWKEK